MHLIYLHIGDFAQATARFTPLQTGIYLQLLCEYYKTEKPLQNDFKNLCWLCGAQFKNEIEAVRFVLEKCFTLDEAADVWVQKRCELEIAKYAAHGVQSRYAILCRHWDKVNKGYPKPTFEQFAKNPDSHFDRITGRIRVLTNRKPLVLESYGDGYAGLPEPNYLPSNQEPSNQVTSNQESTPIVPKGTRSGPDESAIAEAIYGLYPRKQGRSAALKAITQELKSSGLTELEMQAKVREFAAAVKAWPDGQHQYVPMPATWFNQGRWADDPSTWVRTEPPASRNGFSAQKKEGGGGVFDNQPAAGHGQSAAPPDGWESAMPEIFGGDWRAFMPLAFELLKPGDQAQVRRFLREKNEGGAE